MTPKFVIVAAAGLIPSACGQSAPIEIVAPAIPVDFDELIGFSDVEYCVPNERFEKLLDGLLPTGPLGEAIKPYKPFFPASHRRAFGQAKIWKDDYTNHANVSVSGIWKNLEVSDISVFKTPESDYQGFAITFNAPFEKARTILNELGFKLPASGRREAGEELVSYVHLDSKAGKVTLTCTTG